MATAMWLEAVPHRSRFVELRLVRDQVLARQNIFMETPTKKLIPPVELAVVMPGAIPMNMEDRGINDTFIGFVEAPSGQHKTYIKIFDPSAWDKQLANELICGTMLRAMGLRTPQTFLLQVFPQDLPQCQWLQNRTDPVFGFGSRASEGAPVARRIRLGEFSDPLQVLAKDMDFFEDTSFADEWIANVDRHPGNYLLSTGNEFWLIDHGHCLTGSHWHPGLLDPCRRYSNQLADLVFPGSLSLPERHRIKKKCEQFALNSSIINVDDVFDACHVRSILKADEYDAAVDFLKERLLYLASFFAERMGMPLLLSATLPGNP